MCGEGVIPLLCYLMEHRWLQEHIFFLENVVQFFQEAFWIAEKVLGDMYDLQWVVFGPDMLGFPCTRQRLFLVGRHRSHVVCTRQFNDSSLSKFSHVILMEADALFMATDQVVQAAENQVRAKHGLGDLREGHQVLPVRWFGVGNHKRLLEHVQQKPALVASGTCSTVNTQQSWKMSSLSPLLGSLQRQSKPYSVRLGRTMLPCEALGMMGLDCWGYTNFPFEGTSMLSSLSDNHIRSLAGNTIHGACMFVVVLEVLASTIRIPQLTLQSLQLNFIDGSYDVEETHQ